MSENSSHSHDAHALPDPHDFGHTVPYPVYLKVFVSLLVLTVITVVISRFDFGEFNLVVAMLIASIKALLVALFFMHLKFENKIVWLYAGVPLFLLGVMLIGIFIDNPYRMGDRQPSRTTEHIAPKYNGSSH
ncbi:MAG TPA: cytochrome C oxidase subunit IV family protein [Oligoflexia bacterium]|nr:cytochrome C oxidase subunit IV family protein [Oligoflexia bacterium]HMP26920.1 cytochrome C oxidase subunit IV family protein [Oligoflexia bacterium]